MKSLVFSLLLINAHATSFLLVRHGQTDWNIQNRWQGHIDVPLNDRGRAQALELSSFLKDYTFDLCFSSDLKRATETASILTNLEINPDMRLRERSFGILEGLLYDDASPLIETEAEPLSSLSNRVFECLEEIAKTHPTKQILIVTHGGVIAKILADLLCINCAYHDIKALNMATLNITYSDDKWNINNFTGITFPKPQPASSIY